MIFESQLISATNADAMSTGRLNAIPYGGQLTLLFLADLGDATNNYTLTIQTPDGKVPVDAQRVWASSAATDMTIDDREVMRFEFVATQGGHFTVTLTEGGTAVCAFVAVLRP